MEFPNQLKYAKTHQWVRLEGNNAIVGITDFAQKQLKDIVFIELPKKGRVVKAGEILLSIESIKSVSDVPSPVAGEIIEANNKLLDTPDLVNKDCYGEGWLVKIKASGTYSLISADEYKKILNP